MASGIPNNIDGNWYIDGTLVNPRAAQLNTIANAGYTTTATAAGTTTLTVNSTYLQYFTGTTTQTVTLPVATTMTLGYGFKIVNNSTGAVTVQSSGANTLTVMQPNTVLEVSCILASGTGTASWNPSYYAQSSITSSVIAVASAVSLTTATIADVTSISLPAGKWLVQGNVAFTIGGVATAGYGWINNASITLPDFSLYNVLSLGVGNPNALAFNVPPRPFTLTTTTTIYLTALAAFSTSTMTVCGGIHAIPI